MWLSLSLSLCLTLAAKLWILLQSLAAELRASRSLSRPPVCRSLAAARLSLWGALLRAGAARD